MDDEKEDQMEASQQSTADQNTCKMLIMVDKPSNDMQITSEQATMTFDNKVIVSESVTIE